MEEDPAEVNALTRGGSAIVTRGNERNLTGAWRHASRRLDSTLLIAAGETDRGVGGTRQP